MNNQLVEVYRILFNHYGAQNWWPGEGLEIAIGAVLTQQTSWVNVEKALNKLREADCLTIGCLKEIPINKLEELIQSSGYYRVKSKRLKNLIELLANNPNPTREELLSVNGLGFETADSILLYWFEKLYFVIDAYTFRIFNRLGIHKERDYLNLQRIFINELPTDIQLYKEYHALIVKHAKECCLKQKPKCDICALNEHCDYYYKLKKTKTAIKNN